MEIKLLHNSPLWLASHAIRMSHDNHNKSDSHLQQLDSGDYIEWVAGPKDAALIERVGNKLKHKSVLEQLVYWFDIDGVSRALLQELARHRTARLTVKSSRYTLNELKDETSFLKEASNEAISKTFPYSYRYDFERASKYVVFTGLKEVDAVIIENLENLRELVALGLANDLTKYALPEAFKTKLQWEIDGRNLQNFLELRSAKDALWEIREMASAIFNAIPDDHKYLFEDYMRD